MRLQPAFWGGLFIGVLSALPFVSALNICCCLWVIAGGVLTSYLLQERSLTPLTAGDGALTGLIAGAIGAVIAAVLGHIMAVMQGVTGPGALDQLPTGDLPPEVIAVFEQLRDMPPAIWFIAPLVIYVIVFPVFGLLGGLLGVAMFRRSTPPPPGWNSTTTTRRSPRR
jgi:hypothetical protein